MEKDIIINKATATGIMMFDVMDYQPKQEVLLFDIKTLLFKELIVKEKEFKDYLSAIDFSVYKDKIVAIVCTVDAIIPSWVYMFIAAKLEGVAFYYDYADTQSVLIHLWQQNIQQAPIETWVGQKVVVRAHANIPEALYIAASKRLLPVVATLM